MVARVGDYGYLQDVNPDSLLQQFQFAEGEEIQALFRIAPNLKVVNKLHIKLKVKFSGFV